VPCPRCGAPNRAQARFCHDCGSPLAVAEEHIPAADAPEATRTTSVTPALDDREIAAGPVDDRRDADRSEELSFGPRGGRDERSSLRHRAVTIPLAVAAIVAALALVGWLAKWPTTVFGAKQAAATAGQSPAPTRPATPATSPAGTPTATTPSPTPTASVSPTPTATANPAVATVDAYFAAINHRHYATAWNLLADAGGTSYAVFVKGFSGTVKDTVTILAVRGGVVTVRLSALHSNGEVQVFEGTYTVRNGVIVSSDVQQVS
jgi:eukaryotic-like serine/threonine-protein kinase